MLGKVEICGVNTTKLPTLTAAETDALLHRAKEAFCIILPDHILVEEFLDFYRFGEFF